MPVEWSAGEWPRHPVVEWQRAKQGFDQPLDEQTVRNAMAAYYGMVTFMDEQLGRVLHALDRSGQRASTRIMYSTDHGEQLGEHGLWWKSSMYEGSVGIPLILSGPDVPSGKVVNTNVSLLDCFPTIVDAVGAKLAPEDSDLPGESLIAIANRDDHPRTVFGEYHAILSPTGFFLLRDGRYKLVYYVGYEPQLFDLVDDPFETRDLAKDPRFAKVVTSCEQSLRAICQPEEVDRLARADQRRKLDLAGGEAAVLAGGVKIPYSPAPDRFDPAQIEARERDRPLSLERDT